MDTNVGLGLLLSRAEEASLGWGRPLDSYSPATASFDPKTAAMWVRKNAVRDNRWMPTVTFVVQPFDGIPSMGEGRWWLWWHHVTVQDDGRPGMHRVFAQTEHLRLAQEAYASGREIPLRPWPGVIDDYIGVGAELTRRNPGETVAHYVGGGRVGALPVLRALAVPQLTPTSRASAFAHFLAREGDALAAARLSSLFATPEQHAEMLGHLPDNALLRTSTPEHRPSVAFSDWATLLCLLGALPDQSSALAAYERLVSARSGADNPDAGRNLGAPGLAVLGEAALPHIAAGILTVEDPYEATASLAVLAARVHGPAAVPTMVRLARRAPRPELAKRWLAQHPRALASCSESFTGADVGVVEDVVRQVLAGNRGAFAEDVANPTVRELTQRVRAESGRTTIPMGGEPTWWREAAEAEAACPIPDDRADGAFLLPLELPNWADPSALPPVVVDGFSLPPAMVREVLLSAARGLNDPLLVPRPLAAAIRSRMSDRDRDALALRLLRGWVGSDSPSPGRVAIAAAAFLGVDGFAQALAPLILTWRGASMHQRAAFGLLLLAATGTRIGLQTVSAISTRSKYPALQKAAADLMGRMADACGLTVLQLEDRAVPDGGLDSAGRRPFRFGARLLVLSLSPRGTLLVWDADASGAPIGRPRPTLPAPRRGDDVAGIASAKAEFALVRKQIADIFRLQSARLEQAMVAGRTWAASEHREFVVGNPVLRSLVQPLVWAVCAGSGRTLVRIDDAGAYVKVDDTPFVLPDDATLSLLHPLDLVPEERASWQAHLADFDLVAPFEQLDRLVMTPDLSGGLLPREFLPEADVDPRVLVRVLERLGGRRGPVGDGAMVDYCVLPFPHFGQTMVVAATFGIEDREPVAIESAVLCPTGAEPFTTLDWSQADRRVLSESLRALRLMAGEDPPQP